MPSYQIHVLSKHNDHKVLISVELLNDYAAMRRADGLASEYARVELWRSGSCIYAADKPQLALTAASSI